MKPLPGTDAGPAQLLSGVDEPTVFRSLFLSYPDSLLLVDRDGVIMMSNPSAARLLGYGEDELNGLNVDTLVPDTIRPDHAALREAYGRAPRPRPMGMQTELTAKRKDGSEVVVEIALSPLQSLGRSIVVVAIRDIGAYPRVVQALQRARYSEHVAQLGRLAVDARDVQAVIEQLPLVAAEALQVEMATVFLLSSDQRELRIASGVGLLSGEAVGGTIPTNLGTPWSFLLDQARAVTVDDYAQETRFAVPRGHMAAGLVSGLAVPLMERGRVIGGLSVRSRVARRFGSDEIRFLESLANMLATRLQRAQSEEALNHAQRLETVGQLTGGIAHDFNNLLTVIHGNLEVLESLLGTDAYAQQCVASALRASRLGAELTGKLLTFSRRQMLQPGRVNVGDLLRSLCDMLRRTLDQRIRIEVASAPQAMEVLADPGQLESALLNLAINARDAMPEGGVLAFRASACTALPAQVRQDLGDAGRQDDAYVAISVSDSGHGMPDDVRERAFEPFFTTKASSRGTGLGLSTVYGFVKQTRGAVELASKRGEGTRVTLFLPQPADATPLAGAAAAAAAADRQVPPGLRVMLVEDDAEVRRVIQSFLAEMGCEVTAAGSAEEAQLLLTGEVPFDLLLSDIALGTGMRGTELARWVKGLNPAMAILLTSGFSAELIAADRNIPLGWELLRKPYARAELARAVAAALAGRQADR